MSYDNDSFSALCEDANRIAAQLRGQGYRTRAQVKKQVRLNTPRATRATATGVPGKGGYLRAIMEAKLVEVLAYCRAFYEENDQLPTTKCVMDHFDVSKQVTMKYMQNLREAGHIERNAAGNWRFTRRAS